MRRLGLTAGLALFALVPATARAGDASFPADRAGSIFTGNDPAFVAVGDFNEDGDQDLAIVNQGSNNLTIAVGGAGSSFNIAGTVATGSGPTSVAVGDFNTDGDEDLAITNGTSGTLRVVLGGVGAAFGAPVDYGVGAVPRHVVVGDFNSNADSHMDLAVVNTSSYTVSVLTGNGTGGFTVQPGGLPTNAYPRFAAVGDFNSDGDDDLAIAYRGQIDSTTAGGVNVYVGNPGGIAFTGGGGFTLPSMAYAVAVGDFNADGDEDLAVTHMTDPPSSTGEVSVAIATGATGATFGTPASFSLGPNTSEVPFHLAVGDFNSDADEDLVVVDYANDVVRLATGGTGASFSKLDATLTGGGDPSAVAIGDFDADGNEDLAVSWRQTNTVTLRPGGGTPPLGGNLLVNGGFEGSTPQSLYLQAPPPIPGWQRTGGMTYMRYGITPNWGIPTHLDSPRYQTGGLALLTGGNSGGVAPFRTTASQTVGAGLTAATVDAGLGTAHLSAWLGGGLAFPDSMTATATFLSDTGAELGALTLGPVTAADRGNATKLLRRAGSSSVPTGTRQIRVTMTSQDNDQYSSAMADNVKLTVSTPDGDGDGALPPQDCDDNDARRRSGAPEVFDNGVDEDCSGADAADPDRDKDGSPRPADCNDASPFVRPGAQEIPGNGIDEDCKDGDGFIFGVNVVLGTVAYKFLTYRTYTKISRLRARKLTSQDKVEISCSGKGCPKALKRKKTLRPRGKATEIDLKGYFRKGRIKPPAKLTVRITRPKAVGQQRIFTFRPRRVPRVQESCLSATAPVKTVKCP